MKIFSNYVFKSKDTVISEPPEEFKKISNIYIEPISGKLVIEYES